MTSRARSLASSLVGSRLPFWELGIYLGLAVTLAASTRRMPTTKSTLVSSPGMTPPALAATAMEGTPVTTMPIAVPVSSVRRLFDCAGCTACPRCGRARSEVM